MRIVINDSSGHPFQVQLSRALAARGHDVLHIHFADFHTPKADLVRRDGDPPSFTVTGLRLGKPFAKNKLVRRRFQEVEYGRVLSTAALAFRPDIVVGCNNAIDVQRALQAACRRASVPFVFWLQDIYSIAIQNVLRKRLPVLGRIIGLYYEWLERRLLRRSDSVVSITEDFLPVLQRWGVARERCTVVRNWAPLDAIKQFTKDNEWSRTHGLSQGKVVLYTGTLGLKHDPMLLVDLAERLRARADVTVLVVSEGAGAELVAREALSRKLANLRVLPFQPFEVYGEVLASADVLLAMIEPAAGVFSVPSKVLSYLCAGRPVVLSVPPENLAARTVRESGAGRVVAPGDRAAVHSALLVYLDNAQERQAAGRRARAYAEKTFDIEAIAGRFDGVLRAAQRQAP